MDPTVATVPWLQKKNHIDMSFPNRKGQGNATLLYCMAGKCYYRGTIFSEFQVSGNPDCSKQGTAHKINVQPSALIPQSARFSYGGYHTILDQGKISPCVPDRVFTWVFTLIAHLSIVYIIFFYLSILACFSGTCHFGILFLGAVIEQSCTLDRCTSYLPALVYSLSFCWGTLKRCTVDFTLCQKLRLLAWESHILTNPVLLPLLTQCISFPSYRARVCRSHQKREIHYFLFAKFEDEQEIN